MRLEPMEGAMYSRMDKRDHMKVLLMFCGLAGSVSLFLMASRVFLVPGIVLGAAAAVLACYGGASLYRVRRLIMPIKGCFLELQRDFFVVRQVFRDGQYEFCRIYYDEVREVVRDRDGFYVQAELVKGFIRGPGVKERTCFQVRAFGYEAAAFEAYYSALLKKLEAVPEITICEREVVA